MPPSLATVAQYFRIGIEAGICDVDEAREWALAMIGIIDEPPGEIIEVSWRKPRAQTIEDLNAVQGEIDFVRAAGWLFATLREMLPVSNDRLRRATQQAMQVARCAGLNEDVYDDFDRIDDMLSLAESNTYGSVDDCREAFDEAVKTYRLPNFDACT